MLRPSFRFSILLATMLAFACTEESTTIWITHVATPTLEGSSCTASDTVMLGGTMVGSGPYGAFLNVVNAIRGNASDIANDSNWVQVQGIEVTLTDASGNAIGEPFSSAVGGGVIPSASGPTDLGEATVFAVIIPAGVALPAGGQVIATVVPFGETLGGLDVEGAPFSFPIFISGGACPAAVCPEDANANTVCSSGCTDILLATDPACASTTP